jgi:hypothetical protein
VWELILANQKNNGLILLRVPPASRRTHLSGYTHSAPRAKRFIMTPLSQRHAPPTSSPRQVTFQRSCISYMPAIFNIVRAVVYGKRQCLAPIVTLVLIQTTRTCHRMDCNMFSHGRSFSGHVGLV